MIGLPEMMIILVIVGVVFGAGKLPQVMEALGHGMKVFRQASRELDEVREEVKSAATAPPRVPPPEPPGPDESSHR